MFFIKILREICRIWCQTPGDDDEDLALEALGGQICCFLSGFLQKIAGFRCQGPPGGDDEHLALEALAAQICHFLEKT